MNLTKRDLADIALVVLALWFLMQSSYILLTGCNAWFIAKMSFGATTGRGLEIGKWLTLAPFLAQLACAGGLLLLRPFLLDRLFPDAAQKSMVLPAGAAMVFDYAFWIRLIGLYSLLSSGIKLVSVSAGQFMMRHDYMGPAYQFWNPMLVPLVAVLLSCLVIWQAKALARLVKALGSCGQPPSSSN
jgi:hypothetical protein